MASKIDSFIVFDGQPQPQEEAPPLLYYSKNSTPENILFAQNQAGIFLTLIKFSKFFTNQVPADYMLTNKHEVAIMELQDNIWLSVSKFNSVSPNRKLLLAILLSCKRLYQLFFPPPVRDPQTNQITRKSAKMIQSSFQQIVLAISQTNLTFIHLFDSYFQLRPPKIVTNEFDRVLRYLQHKGSPIQNMAIMYSRNFLYSSFPKDVTQTLAFSLQMKFPYLFPRVLMKDEERLYWIIGLSRSADGRIDVYAPPLLYDNTCFPFVGLKYKKYKIFLSIKSDIVPTPEMLNKIPPTIKPLKTLFSRLNIVMEKGQIQEPFIIIESSSKTKKLSLVNQKISDTQIPNAELDIIRAHSYAHVIGDQSASVAFPGKNGYFMYFNIHSGIETAVLAKISVDGISKMVTSAEELHKSAPVQHIKILKK